MIEMKDKKGDCSLFIIALLPIFILILFVIMGTNPNKTVEYEGTLTSIEKVDNDKSIGQFYNLSFDNGDFHILVLDNKKILSNDTKTGLNYGITYHSEGGNHYIDSLVEIIPPPPSPTPHQWLVNVIMFTTPITIILLGIIFTRLYCMTHKKPRWMKKAEKALLLIGIVPLLAYGYSYYRKY